MDQQTWVFFTPDGKQEISVIGLESARNLAELMSIDQRRWWKVQRNRASNAELVQDCLALGMGKKPDLESQLLDDVSIEMPKKVEDRAELDLRLEEDLPEEKSLPQPKFVERVPVAKLMQETSEPKIVRPVRETPTHRSLPENLGKPAVRAATMPNMSKSAPAPAPQAAKAAAPTSHQVKKEATAVPAGARKAERNDKRRHLRVDARLRVVLISGNRSFRSFSKNLSKGGLLLENPIPVELAGEHCRVIIGSTDLKENLEFEGRLVGNSENPKALCFTEGKDVYLKKLDHWIESMKKAA